ncbi:DUF2680 domain-containing protein [Sediminibacillus dalangtanensis]|uniref:DUF2680 domain-containing protein n=1 Tax=Sediminibacillus dalangtanensis TaxID=2729421 RepID=A0ABX7VZ71_9BACI|nr:YckD family protein [Sediminibacillus dalangtanensis]QTN01041.1 DUF2680 domain-containing protein [Sediminibacillus dalangtanensis]
MERFCRSCFAISLLVAVLFLGAGSLQAEDQESPEKMPELTESQQKELAIMYQDMFDKRKGIISKYVEFGVIEKEKADQIIKHLDEHYQMLEENGFVIDHKHHKAKHHDKVPH